VSPRSRCSAGPPPVSASNRPPALEGFAFAWLENQLTAATKLMPLGQSRAQRLLSGFLPRLPALVEQALQCDDSAIGAALPGMAFASGRHESQYCRLFRS
jgi:urease accessory protein